jgi:molybdopterin synthase catalytic subunit
MNFVKVLNSKLSVEEISNLVSSPSCGAISLFVGTTRDNFENKEVSLLFCSLLPNVNATKWLF